MIASWPSILADPDPTQFTHVRDVGFWYHGDGRSIYLTSLSIARDMSDEDLGKFASVMQDFMDGVSKRKQLIHSPSPRVILPSDLRNFAGRYVYKFVRQSDYDLYVSRRSFLVSSLRRYRQMEDQGDPAGDRFEGMAFGMFDTPTNKQVCVHGLSGFDAYVFSATTSPTLDRYMANTFGEVVLRIEVAPFAKAIAKLLGASSFGIRETLYSDFKLFRGKWSRRSLRALERANGTITPALAQKIRESLRTPSIFGKPIRFSREREVRVAFYFERDVPEEFTTVEDSRLLRFVSKM